MVGCVSLRPVPKFKLPGYAKTISLFFRCPNACLAREFFEFRSLPVSTLVDRGVICSRIELFILHYDTPACSTSGSGMTVIMSDLANPSKVELHRFVDGISSGRHKCQTGQQGRYVGARSSIGSIHSVYMISLRTDDHFLCSLAMLQELECQPGVLDREWDWSRCTAGCPEKILVAMLRLRVAGLDVSGSSSFVTYVNASRHTRRYIKSYPRPHSVESDQEMSLRPAQRVTHWN
nr:hypothetical protein CFP56_02884 [Quercus suber]